MGDDVSLLVEIRCLLCFGDSSLGGVFNHFRLHCRLAKFRGLMRRVKYGAVIGHKMHFFVCAQYELPGYGFLFSQSHRRISPSSSNHGISPNDSVNDSG